MQTIKIIVWKVTIPTLQPVSKYHKDGLGINTKTHLYVMPESFPFECRSTWTRTARNWIFHGNIHTAQGNQRWANGIIFCVGQEYYRFLSSWWWLQDYCIELLVLVISWKILFLLLKYKAKKLADYIPLR